LIYQLQLVIFYSYVSSSEGINGLLFGDQKSTAKAWLLTPQAPQERDWEMIKHGCCSTKKWDMLAARVFPSHIGFLQNVLSSKAEMLGTLTFAKFRKTGV